MIQKIQIKNKLIKMKYCIIIFLLSLMINSTSAQQRFKSPKYGYSFTIPDGWRIKNQIILLDTDVKIVDDKGNSFIVSVSTPFQFQLIS